MILKLKNIFTFRKTIRNLEIEKCEQWGSVMKDIINRKPLLKEDWEKGLKTKIKENI